MNNDSASIENIALFDLDGTLCDFDGANKISYDKLKSPQDPVYGDWSMGNEPEYIKNRLDLIRSSPGWWENLEKLKAGFDILDVARDLGYMITVLTKGPGNISKAIAWSEKVKWTKKHIPGAAVTITEDKGLVYGKVLVDDWPNYVERWLEHRPRGLVIMPTQRWNKDYEHPNVVRYDGSNLEEVIRAMSIAKSRRSGEALRIR